MENKEQIDGLLAAYLMDELDRTRKDFLLDWIDESDENRQYYLNFKAAWELAGIGREVSSTDIDEDWRQFKQLWKGESLSQASSIEPASEMEIGFTKEPARKGAVYWLIRVAASAAAVLLLFFLWPGNRDKGKHQDPMAANKQTPQSVSGIMRTELNNTKADRQIKLSDGSRVMLGSDSRISYREPFDNDKRDIYLEGKALFIVAKDSARPFTVKADNIATTALGTRFMVKNIAGAGDIEVALQEGWVRVRDTMASGKQVGRLFDLAPGQRLVYNRKAGTIKVASVQLGARSEHPNEELVADSQQEIPTIPARPGTWYLFNNQPLGEVLDQLAAIYNVRIVYDKKQLRGKFFIGEFQKTDSIENILQYITLLNNLKLTKNQHDFEIK